MSKAVLHKSSISFFKTCNHIVVHYWELTSSFIHKIKMATVGSHLNDLRLCNTTHRSISALFDEWGQGRSVMTGSLTNHTTLLTQWEPLANWEMLHLITNRAKIYQCFYNELIPFKAPKQIHCVDSTIYRPLVIYCLCLYWIELMLIKQYTQRGGCTLNNLNCMYKMSCWN